MSTQANDRDTLRSHALKSRAPRAKIVAYDGVEYEIKQPTVGARGDLLKRCMTQRGDGEMSVDPHLTLIWATIFCTFVPGTDTKVFEEADFDGLCSGIAGNSICDALGAEIMPLMNLDTAENMEGNSDATLPDLQ